MTNYINATPKAGKDFYVDFSAKGEVVMLNLLKFKSTADYSGFEQIQPKIDLTGEEAFKLYSQNTSQALKNIGSEIMFFGKSNRFLIGPDFEKWDAILLVKHQSVQAFMQFAESEAYLNNVGHRTAALEDSRLLPSTEIKNFGKY